MPNPSGCTNERRVLQLGKVKQGLPRNTKVECSKNAWEIKTGLDPFDGMAWNNKTSNIV